jgi:hypothetical protein
MKENIIKILVYCFTVKSDEIWSFRIKYYLTKSKTIVIFENMPFRSAKSMTI